MLAFQQRPLDHSDGKSVRLEWGKTLALIFGYFLIFSAREMQHSITCKEQLNRKMGWVERGQHDYTIMV